MSIMTKFVLLVLAWVVMAGPACAGGAVLSGGQDVVVQSTLDGDPAAALDAGLDGALLAQNGRRRARYQRHDDDDDDDYRVRSRRGKNRHVRRRNIAIGATALGLVTGSGLLTGIGIGGIAANEFARKDRRRGVR